MKPRELLSNLDDKEDIYVIDRNILEKYFDDDCVVAYDLNKLGTIIIFKGIKKSFCFVYFNNRLDGWDIRKRCIRINLKQAIELLEDDCIILNKKEYIRIRKMVILNKLSN